MGKTVKAGSPWPGCKVFKPKRAEEEQWQGAKSSGLLNPGYLADRVWPGADFGRAFAYLFRRFGETRPFDWHKQLCNYDLTTPHPDVAFWVSPSPSSVGMRPGYWVRNALYERIWAERGASRDWPESAEKDMGFPVVIPPAGTATREAIDAIEAGMRDLLRPVWIRDMPINILGPLSDEDAAKFEAAKHAWKG